MPEVKLTAMLPGPDDALYVVGYIDGKKIETQGHQSAITHYYPPEMYGKDGHLVDGAVPREMNADEIRQYGLDLLYPPPAVIPAIALLAKVKLDEPPPEPEPQPEPPLDAGE